MKHLHHKIPRHAGGTDDSSNLIELTVEEHAEAHLALYLEYGRWQDWVAAMALSGQSTHQEATLEAIRTASRLTCQKRNATNNPMKSQKSRDKMADSRRKYFKNNPEAAVSLGENMRAANIGKVRTQEDKDNKAEAARNRWKDPEARKRQAEAVRKSWIKRRAK